MWDNSNHSQGDDGLGQLKYTEGRCKNNLGVDSDNEDVICGAPCNPAEQFCHWCRRK